jgi:alkylation response protein AidB-like acyl-CoA dehydrogenase
VNFDDTPQEAALRRQARDWIQANAPHELRDELANAPLFSLELKSVDPLETAKAWQKKKQAAGWACAHWPKAYGGRDAALLERVIWDQEEGVYGRLSQPFSIGVGMAAPTVMAYATEDQKRTLLPKIASGEEIWCQLFSEPVAGSDLAGLATKAAPDGEGWRINGQKVWTSWAHHADWGLLLARTDPTVPKHKGLRLSASGVPTGFEQIFDLTCNLEGPDGPVVDDPAVRAKLAHWATTASGLKYTLCRTLTSLSRGETPGPESSVGKLAAASTLQSVTHFALDLLGEHGQLTSAAPEHGGGWFQAMAMRSPALRIEAGSDEILRNIIAERVLGLPGDIRVDKDVAYEAIPKRGSRLR